MIKTINSNYDKGYDDECNNLNTYHTHACACMHMFDVHVFDVHMFDAFALFFSINVK